MLLEIAFFDDDMAYRTHEQHVMSVANILVVSALGRTMKKRKKKTFKLSYLYLFNSGSLILYDNLEQRQIMVKVRNLETDYVIGEQ